MQGQKQTNGCPVPLRGTDRYMGQVKNRVKGNI